MRIFHNFCGLTFGIKWVIPFFTTILIQFNIFLIATVQCNPQVFVLLTPNELFTLANSNAITDVLASMCYLDFFGIILLKTLEVDTCNPVHNK